MALPFGRTVCLPSRIALSALTLISEVIGDVHDIIEDAAQKDSQIMKTYNRLSSRLGFHVSHHLVP